MDSTTCPFNGTVKYFVLKSFSLESVLLSIKHNVWSTSLGPTEKLVDAFRRVDNVILFFSVNESGGFQGYARMMANPCASYKPGLF
mmetsp:Transcript_60168/g.82688  ORF Transcript_60168/g.82688 Transcript_60168/m.82688 type:complete len:86 (+) Transcript_60168:414-671(+)